VPHVELLVQNYYLARILISRLEQPVVVAKGVPIKQTIVVALPINIHVTTGLHVYGNGVPIY